MKVNAFLLDLCTAGQPTERPACDYEGQCYEWFSTRPGTDLQRVGVSCEADDCSCSELEPWSSTIVTIDRKVF